MQPIVIPITAAPKVRMRKVQLRRESGAEGEADEARVMRREQIL